MARRPWLRAPVAAAVLLLLLLAQAADAQKKPAAGKRPPGKKAPPRKKPVVKSAPPKKGVTPKDAGADTPPLQPDSEQGAYYSALWGRNGEAWSARGPIADHSSAGYMGQTRDIPRYTRVFNVRAAPFNAKGDGEADDTAAVLAALKAAQEAAYQLSTVPCGHRNSRRCLMSGLLNAGKEGVVVLLPAGRYKITQTIEITQPNVVIRGDGVGKTVLWMPKGLEAVYGKKQQWATGGAFIIINGNNAGSNQKQYALADITQDARRGERDLRVNNADGIAVGQYIRIYALAKSPARRRRQLLAAAPTAPAAPKPAAAEPGYLPLSPALARSMEAAAAAYEELEDEMRASPPAGGGVSAAAQAGTLDAYLYGNNLVDSGKNSFATSDHIRFLVKVVAKGKDWVRLERPLPYDLRVRWQPKVYNYYSTVQHSGVEDLTMQFAWDVYPEHLKTRGYNAIELQSVTNCWVRNVKVIDADNGVHMSQCDWVTVQHFSIEVTKPRWTPSTEGDNGHHALWVSKCGYTLFQYFAIKDPYMHDLSVDIFSEQVVFTSGAGKDLNIDCHRAGPHNHLFSNLNFGLGTRPFKSGGDPPRGAYAGANNTFWNLRASSASPPPLLKLPDCTFGPLLNFIGRFAPPPSYTPTTKVTNSKGKVIKEVPQVYPPDAAFSRRPAWCTATKWYVESHLVSEQLVPGDLFDAMVATRRARLGI